ncbi:TRAM domain-containing protein [Candidatus Woesearchaeota archaeon]|nr:TRAM domain-containing protein [Candidatus Woesearchaeota archaeon]
MYERKVKGLYAYHQGSRGGSRTPPVQVGEELDVTIEAVGEKGDGIAKKNGFVLFIPGGKEGERIRVKVTKVLTKVGFAEKIGEAESAAEPERPPRPTTEEAEEVLEAPQYETSSYEDSEDFGEEPVEEEVSEEVEEEPAEEPSEDDDFSEEDDEEKQ